MTPEQFAYWLQGYAEISGKQPTESEWQVIKDHLQTVFNKVTPDRLTWPPSAPQPGQPGTTIPPGWTPGAIIC